MRRVLSLIFVLTIIFGMPPVSGTVSNPSEIDNELDDLIALANSFIQRRTEALISSEGDYSPSILSNDGAKESSQLWNSERLALAELDARRKVLGERGEAYTHSDTTLTLVNTEIESQRVVLDFKESSKLYYAKINGDEPEYTAWKALRQFVFEKSGEVWELVSHELIDRGPAPINEPTGVTEGQMRSSLNSREIPSEKRIRRVRMIMRLVLDFWETLRKWLRW